MTVWRRSYDIPPPDLDKASEHYPGNDPKYAMLDEACLPTTESLYTTALRVIPYWQSVIVPDIKGGKKVLIAAHGNSLRALVQVRGAPVSRARRRSRARAHARSRLSEGARSVRAAHAPAPQYLDNISNDEITELNIPTACPLVCVWPKPGRLARRLGAPALSTASRVIGRYELDDAMRPIKSPLGIGPLSGRYLGDQARAIFTARERRARGN